MPITNLKNQHLTEEQKNSFREALKTLEDLSVILTNNLSPDERQRYGSVNEQHKLLINKVRDYRRTNPELAVPDIDWAEFEADYLSRVFLEDCISRIAILHERFVNQKTLHDYDNYQAALEDYGYTNYRAGSQATGYGAKQAELKQFFVRRRNDPKAAPESPATP